MLCKNDALFRMAALVFGILFMVVTSGCSVVMAIKQPDYKDVTILEKRTSRSEVIAELGAPLHTEEKDGKKKDLFVFKQGYGKGNKALRALFHTAADVFTLFLWEVIGTPTEAIASGRQMKIEVFYDENDYVVKANILSDKKKEDTKVAQEKEEVKESEEPEKNFGP